MFRIYFDTNEGIGNGNYSMNLDRSIENIAPIADQLYDGLHVIIYMVDELEMEAIPKFDNEHKIWTATPLLKTSKYSDEGSNGV